jgi:hypothetical protein
MECAWEAQAKESIRLRAKLDEMREALEKISRLDGGWAQDNVYMAKVTAREVLVKYPEGSEKLPDIMITCSNCGEYHSIYAPCKEEDGNKNTPNTP